MGTSNITQADVSIVINMRREWACERKTEWRYSATLISNEFGENLGSFDGGNIQYVINKASVAAQQYVTNEAVNYYLKQDDCGDVKSADCWAQLTQFDYAKSGRIADKLIGSIK